MQEEKKIGCSLPDYNDMISYRQYTTSSLSRHGI
jgi:hypothetical protein